MMVFFLLTTGMGIGGTLIDERNNKIYKRINSFPVKKKEYLIGKILANGIVAGIQAISIILVTRIAFGVHWGTDLMGLSLIVLLIVFISCGIGIIFSNFISSSGALTASLTMIL